MYLKKLSLTNFKNYQQIEIDLSKKVNCFVGLNGEGKTNLLDAIYYLSFCKSFLNPVDSQNILHDNDFFVIQGAYFKNGNESGDTIHCSLKRNQRKKFKINKNEYERFADHIGLFPLVIVSPSDVNLIYNGSDERRKYIDGVISQFDKLYLDDLLSYNKVLNQRNTLLKHFSDSNYFDKGALEIWNEQLINFGNSIFKKRNEFLDSFAPVFQKYFDFISQGKEKVEIKYESQLFDNNFGQLLETSVQKDKVLKYTSTGIHKDELVFMIDGYPLKKFGSQGQQKSFLVAVKLAQFEFMNGIKGFKPLLLLDDIFDKLDIRRIEQLMKLVSDNNFGQIFITDTSKERIINIFDRIDTSLRIFDIVNGNAEEDLSVRK